MAGPNAHSSAPQSPIREVASLFVCLCAVLSGCAEMPPRAGAPPASFLPSSAGRPPFMIGLLIAGWHTGIVLPRGELGAMGHLLNRYPRASYLSFGWGNRRFYMAARPRSGDALAALIPSPSALFVQAASSPAGFSAGDARVHWVCLDREELWRADRYIEDSLSQPDGRPVDLGPGPLPDSRFYASSTRYSGVHTCNTWTLAALQYSGLPVRAAGAIFARQVSRRIRGLRACPAP